MLLILKNIFRVQLAKMWGDPTIPMLVFIQPILFSLLFGYLYQAVNNATITTNTFIGVGQIVTFQVLLYAGGIIVRHEFNFERTVSYNLLSSVRLYKIWAHRLMACVFLSSPSILISLLIGMSVFQVFPNVSNIPLMITGILLYLFSLYCMGLPLILLLFLNPAYGGKIIQTLGYPMYLLSGMIISVDHFPSFVKVFSYIFPITWSTHWLQTANITGNINWLELIYTILISLLYLLISGFLYTYIINKIRTKGEINL
jgi:ABC-2 type transport system permease protein